MTETRPVGDLAFRLMSLEFRLRDWIRPPLRVLQAAGMQPGMVVLDFGCGPGGFSVAAARLVGPAGRVYALDIHPLAVASVQRAAARKGLRNLHPVLGSSLAELPDESMDMILLYSVLHEMPESAPALAEIRRLLKAAGTLSVSDDRLPERSILDRVTAGGLFQFSRRDRWTLQFEPTRPGEATS